MAIHDNVGCQSRTPREFALPADSGEMKFAFLIHPLSDETKTLMELDPDGHLHRDHGGDPLSFCDSLHKMLVPARRRQTACGEPRVRVVDELAGLVGVGVEPDDREVLALPPSIASRGGFVAAGGAAGRGH